jgi:hypothetical protein
MNLSIESILLVRLRNEQHAHLMTETLRLITEATPVKLGLEALLPPFQAAWSVENAAIEVERGSLLTVQMGEKDHEREKLYSGFVFLLETNLRHFDKTRQEAAQQLMRVVNKYGNVRRKTNVEATISLRNLSGELQDAGFQQPIAIVEGHGWISQLQAVNEEYSALFNNRNAELSGRISGNVHNARSVINPLYEAIVKRVNAMTELNQTDIICTNFIKQLNGIIEGLKTTMSIQQAEKAKMNKTSSTETKTE